MENDWVNGIEQAAWMKFEAWGGVARLTACGGV